MLQRPHQWLSRRPPPGGPETRRPQNGLGGGWFRHPLQPWHPAGTASTGAAFSLSLVQQPQQLLAHSSWVSFLPPHFTPPPLLAPPRSSSSPPPPKSAPRACLLLGSVPQQAIAPWLQPDPASALGPFTVPPPSFAAAVLSSSLAGPRCHFCWAPGVTTHTVAALLGHGYRWGPVTTAQLLGGWLSGRWPPPNPSISPGPVLGTGQRVNVK